MLKTGVCKEFYYTPNHDFLSHCQGPLHPHPQRLQNLCLGGGRPPTPPSTPASIGLRVPGKHAAGAHQVLASGGGQSNKIRLCITVHVVPAEGNLSLVRSPVPTLAKIDSQGRCATRPHARAETWLVEATAARAV